MRLCRQRNALNIYLVGSFSRQQLKIDSAKSLELTLFSLSTTQCEPWLSMSLHSHFGLIEASITQT